MEDKKRVDDTKTSRTLENKGRSRFYFHTEKEETEFAQIKKDLNNEII